MSVLSWLVATENVEGSVTDPDPAQLEGTSQEVTVLEGEAAVEDE